MITHEPTELEECSEILTGAARDRKRVAFVGGGTSLELGNAGAEPDLVLSTRKLDRVVEYAPEDQVIVAEAGLTLARLREVAAPNAQWFGVDAPLAERATLGGLVAVGGFGPRRLRYGGMRELLLGITLLRADGASAQSGSKVVKNVAGFDLPKVMCGALGTLGLVGRVTLRLHPSPETSRTSIVVGTSATGVVELVRTLRRAQLEPSSVVALRRGAARYDVGVRFEGFERGVRHDVERFMSLLPEAEHATPSPAEAAQFWADHDAARSEGALRVRPNALSTHLPEVEALLEPLLGSLEAPRFAWYASLGVGFSSGAPTSVPRALEALTLARSGLLRLGGSLVVDAAPPAVRGHFDAFGPLPSAFPIMQALKQRFDPERRLNTGRFVGGL
ncbi:MAG TPA: FAD-binding oxidoreductase [Polyangiaceae bacterium]|nr:FAD-binding oxidoreductase [Polyangiaceae bacterium]